MGTQYHLELVNRDGNQLSSELIPMPWVSASILLVSILVLLVVLANWLAHYKQYSLLHRVLCLYPAFKAAASVVSLLYWIDLKNRGYTSVGFQACYYMAYISAELLYLMLLLASASGYGLSIPNFRKENWPIWVSLGVAAPMMALGVYVNGIFSIFVLVVWIGVIAISLRSAGRSYTAAQVIVLEVGHDPEMDEVKRTFSNYLAMLLVWIGVLVVFIVVDISALSYRQWIAQLGMDLLELGFFAFVAFLFRLRSEGSFYKMHPVPISISNASQYTAGDHAVVARAYGHHQHHRDEEKGVEMEGEDSSRPPLDSSAKQVQVSSAHVRNDSDTRDINDNNLAIAATYIPPEDSEDY